MRIDQYPIDTVRLTLKDVAKLIVGEEASKVTLTLFSGEKRLTYTQELERRMIAADAPLTALDQPQLRAQERNSADPTSEQLKRNEEEEAERMKTEAGKGEEMDEPKRLQRQRAEEKERRWKEEIAKNKLSLARKKAEEEASGGVRVNEEQKEKPWSWLGQPPPPPPLLTTLSKQDHNDRRNPAALSPSVTTSEHTSSLSIVQQEEDLDVFFDLPATQCSLLKDDESNFGFSREENEVFYSKEAGDSTGVTDVASNVLEAGVGDGGRREAEENGDNGGDEVGGSGVGVKNVSQGETAVDEGLNAASATRNNLSTGKSAEETEDKGGRREWASVVHENGVEPDLTGKPAAKKGIFNRLGFGKGRRGAVKRET